MLEEKEKIGLIQLYTGDGKGKTSAALGLSLRAAGHGKKTFIIHFMKGNIEYGELKAVKCFKGLITIRQMGRETFVDKNKLEKEDRLLAVSAIELASQIIAENQYDIVILDEINVAIDFGLVSLEKTLEILKKKPRGVEVILTGRYAHPKLIEVSDLVTEMREIKHPFRKGIMARPGIEF